METQFSRTEMLIGNDSANLLAKSRVAVFGIGGVGGYTVEALARAGVGNIDLIDNDIVNITNINRQIYALHSTIGKPKVEVAKERIADINPAIKVNALQEFFSANNSQLFRFEEYDYVVDAIDTVSSKLELITKCQEHKVPIISSMGAGNKLHPELFEISDIYKTSVCPLAKVIRTELKKRNVKKLKVVYSKEIPIKNPESIQKRMPASISFVPSTVGLIIAGAVIRDLISSKL